jgi:hypothetical protein
MFRDSHGVVHTVSSAEPLADLPPGAAAALQDALLLTGPGVDIGSVLERCDAVRELVERWQDAFFAASRTTSTSRRRRAGPPRPGCRWRRSRAGYEDDDDDELDDLRSSTRRSTSWPCWSPRRWSTTTSTTPRGCCPRTWSTVLERELLLLPVRVRLEALVAAGDLVAEWADLVADHEKLLGHLVLAHAEPQERGTTSRWSPARRAAPDSARDTPRLTGRAPRCNTA